MPKKATDKQIADALRESRGVVAEAARLVRMSRTAIYNRVNANADLKAVLDEQRDELLDDAEAALANMALSEHPDQFKALRFLLRTIGRTRGYDERMQIEHSGGIKTEFEVIIPGHGEDAD